MILDPHYIKYNIKIRSKFTHQTPRRGGGGRKEFIGKIFSIFIGNLLFFIEYIKSLISSQIMFTAKLKIHFQPQFNRSYLFNTELREKLIDISNLNCLI